MKRSDSESFEDYKVRRAASNIIPRGKLLWDSSIKGTYKKLRDGSFEDIK